jgi:hypothetical protein
MQIKLKLFSFLLFVSIGLSGQMNLIPNNSFESHTQCPTSTYQLSYATGWTTPQGSPDLYCSCATNSQVSTPKNITGYQCPSNGSCYVGYMAYFAPNYWGNEILGIKLTDSLLIGTTYYVSFKIVLADWGGNYSDACSHHGMKLSTQPFPNLASPNPNAIVDNFAHVYTSQLITDTLNWTTIKGSITADSNYKYIYFGEFFEKANVTYTVLYGPPTDAYYLIDDVCLSTDSNTCKITSQTCTSTMVREINLENTIYISPNPSKEFIKIFGLKSKSHFFITNSLGQYIKEGEISENQEISITDLPSSIYFLHLDNSTYHKRIRFVVDH